jgi:zinc transport system ATP-binding protein
MLQGILGLMPPMEGAVFRNSLKFRDTGYVPQDSAVQKDFPASVSEVVLAGFLGRRGLRPFYSRAEKEAAEANMARLGISDLRKKCYRELSGGQRRRTLLARALCAAVRLLVLDEPAAGLDPPAVFSLYSLLKSLNEKGLTIVMATHNIANLEGSAAHVLHLDKRQIFFGSLKEYRKTAFGERFLLPGEAPHA